MFEAAELALDRRTAAVKLLVALAVARDERVQPVGLDPHRRGLALAGRAAPLRRLALVVRSGERPLAVRAVGRFGSAALDALGFLHRDDRGDAPFHAPLVDVVAVVALVHDRGLHAEPALLSLVDQRE